MRRRGWGGGWPVGEDLGAVGGPRECERHRFCPRASLPVSHIFIFLLWLLCLALQAALMDCGHHAPGQSASSDSSLTQHSRQLLPAHLRWHAR